MARLPTRRSSRPATHAELRELRRLVRDSTAELTTAVERCLRDLEIQFKRIAQIQTELDEIRSVWSRRRRRTR
jgi:hypothetical protein